MKISIAISILILAVAAIFGWTDHQRLAAVTEIHRSLSAEAAALGLSIDLENPAGAAPVTKRPRGDRDAKARIAAKELIAFAIEMEAYKEKGDQSDGAMQDRIVEFMDLMLSLDAGQMKILIAEFRASKEMEDDTRTGMIMFAIMSLATDHPEAALTLFTESEGLFDNEMIGNHVLSSSLANWASTDPDDALEWVRKNGEKYPDMITDKVKAGLVKGAGSNSVAVAFDVLRELQLKDPNNAISGLAGTVGSPAERTEFLTLFRDYLKTSPKSESSSPAFAMRFLGEGIVNDGFKEGSSWIAGNNLSEQELEALAGSIGSEAKSSEKGQWIEWMGESLSGDTKNRQIESTMRNWTQTDYRAAGEWLAAAPASAAKEISVSSYAETVAPHDPQTAAQWALTLPAGSKRQGTLKAVYEKWPQNSPESKAERAAFMAKHPVD
jgi:hypothetical protein